MRAMIRTNSESAMRETQSIADQLIEDIVALLFHPPLGTSERLFSCTDTMIHSRRQHLARRLDDAELPGKFVLSDGRQHGINGFVDGLKQPAWMNRILSREGPGGHFHADEEFRTYDGHAIHNASRQ